ncbi:TetR/AcrR family transcriptional regulator [Altererythrobacter sp. CC-YST694]|uniref:TetR/AcrR family transcriptional regulator n=1 Tax=Altererythrobacter sp. CC-YST694 TaxID=2755038 RepID=UPI001D023D23|nr:TetR/AcrR family transcriptional regulator [Altererythrobacter sp. CC-YST694]MCB5424073.1 TetR/AcrR family transcriptional regulator [Altererythrobacter sp. CC-YST694]
MNIDSHYGVKPAVAPDGWEVPVPMQERSRKTAERFVQVALQLLREKTFAELSVAELARKAGRSVGVFYQRFNSKDDFLHVLLSAYFREALEWREAVRPEGEPATIYAEILARGFHGIMENRNLWHAALERSAADPEFWKVYRSFRERAVEITLRAMEASSDRQFSDEERRQLAIAGQVFNSVINNQIINSPGPLRLEDEDFLPELTRIAVKLAGL